MAVPKNPFVGKKVIQEDDPIRVLVDNLMNTEEGKQLDEELDKKVMPVCQAATTEIVKQSIPTGLLKVFPKNNIASMVLTGAKGSLVNMTQISCLLGQQTLEGRRVPRMQNGKTLPCFLPNDPNPRASGFVSDRFLTGLRPQDFFFHCMGGREGLIDTAVKTSRSGYLQRCLIKQLESLTVAYDMTVRDHDGSIVQFRYGEDSIDVCASKYMDKFQFLEQNFQSIIANTNQEAFKAVEKKKAERLKKELRRLQKAVQQGKLEPRDVDEQFENVLSQCNPLVNFGAISDKMEQELASYIEKSEETREKRKNIPTLNQPPQSDTLKKLYYLKYMKAVANPGENVGTIAAQSVGEPST